MVNELKVSGCIAASDVLELIEAGKHSFDNLYITGVVNFVALHALPNALHFSGSVFEKNPLFGPLLPTSNTLDFTGASIRNPQKAKITIPAASLVNSLSHDATVFVFGIRISEDIFLGQSPYERKYNVHSVDALLYMEDCDIEGQFSAPGVNFANDITFNGSHFKKTVDFSNATFVKNFRIAGNVFDEGIGFEHASFRQDATLSGTFAKSVELVAVRSEGTFLVDGQFSSRDPASKQALRFIQCHFDHLGITGEESGGVIIDSTESRFIWLEGEFGDVEVDGSTFGRMDVGLKSPGQLAIEWTSIGLFILKTRDRGRDVVLSTATFDRAWFYFPQTSADASQLRGDYISLVSLEAALRKVGDAATADEVFYRRKRLEYAHAPFYAKAVDYVVFDLSSRFGTKSSRTFLFAAVIVAAFGLLFSRQDALTARSSSSTVLFRELPVGDRLIAGMFYSLSCFFRFTAGEWEASRHVVQTRVREWKIGRCQITLRFFPNIRRFQSLALFEAILSWIFLALFIATYSHVVLH
ncbi:MAG: hypothetical protein LAO30_10595 [Acidobacteriia bacterium]|nr:hypothetical protein [Terriglobia bacterium]